MRPLPLAALLLAACTSIEPREAPRTGSGGAAAAPRAVASSVRSDDGLEIAYETAGAGAPALVLVHGWSCNRRFWTAQIESFAGAHRLVALDLGGHGASGKDREEWSLAGLARDVVAVLEHEGLEDAILVGHSLGGHVSLLAAALAPERVRAVVGVDTLHRLDFEYTPEVLGPFLAHMETDYAGFFERFVGEGLAPGADPELRAWIVRQAVATPPAVAMALMRAYLGYDDDAALAACPVPVVAVNGTRTPTDLEGLRAVRPDFQVTFVEGTGHFPMLEAPAAFDARLRETIAALSEP